MSEKTTKNEPLKSPCSLASQQTPDIATLTAMALSILANVQCRAAEELKQENAATNGRAKVTAKEAMAVCVKMERQFNRGKLFHPTDFASKKTKGLKRSPNGCMNPAEDTNIAAIAQIVLNKLIASRQAK